jgi:hypothetical protein
MLSGLHSWSGRNVEEKNSTTPFHTSISLNYMKNSALQETDNELFL